MRSPGTIIRRIKEGDDATIVGLTAIFGLQRPHLAPKLHDAGLAAACLSHFAWPRRAWERPSGFNAHVTSAMLLQILSNTLCSGSAPEGPQKKATLNAMRDGVAVHMGPLIMHFGTRRGHSSARYRCPRRLWGSAEEWATTLPLVLQLMSNTVLSATAKPIFAGRINLPRDLAWQTAVDAAFAAPNPDFDPLAPARFRGHMTAHGIVNPELTAVGAPGSKSAWLSLVNAGAAIMQEMADETVPARGEGLRILRAVARLPVAHPPALGLATSSSSTRRGFSDEFLGYGWHGDEGRGEDGGEGGGEDGDGGGKGSGNGGDGGGGGDGPEGKGDDGGGDEGGAGGVDAYSIDGVDGSDGTDGGGATRTGQWTLANSLVDLIIASEALQEDALDSLSWSYSQLVHASKDTFEALGEKGRETNTKGGVKAKARAKLRAGDSGHAGVVARLCGALLSRGAPGSAQWTKSVLGTARISLTGSATRPEPEDRRTAAAVEAGIVDNVLVLLIEQWRRVDLRGRGQPRSLQDVVDIVELVGMCAHHHYTLKTLIARLPHLLAASEAMQTFRDECDAGGAGRMYLAGFTQISETLCMLVRRVRMADVTKTSKKEAKQRRKKEEEGGGSGGGGEGLNIFDGGKALAFAFCGWNECRAPDPAGKFLLCSKCKVARYCSRECQSSDWKAGGHKKVCKLRQAVVKQSLANAETQTKEQQRLDKKFGANLSQAGNALFMERVGPVCAMSRLVKTPIEDCVIVIEVLARPKVFPVPRGAFREREIFAEQEPEWKAHTLSVIERNGRSDGQFITAVCVGLGTCYSSGGASEEGGERSERGGSSEASEEGAARQTSG